EPARRPDQVNLGPPRRGRADTPPRGIGPGGSFVGRRGGFGCGRGWTMSPPVPPPAPATTPRTPQRVPVPPPGPPAETPPPAPRPAAWPAPCPFAAVQRPRRHPRQRRDERARADRQHYAHGDRHPPFAITSYCLSDVPPVSHLRAPDTAWVSAPAPGGLRIRP